MFNFQLIYVPGKQHEDTVTRHMLESVLRLWSDYHRERRVSLSLILLLPPLP